MSGDPLVVLRAEELREIVSAAVRDALSERRAFSKRIGEKDAAAYLGIGRSTLADMRSAGTAPPYHVLGGQYLYDVSDLEKFLAARRVDGRPAPPRPRLRAL